jgi:hypothetical protein
MAGWVPCITLENRSRRCSMLEPGLRNNGLSSERKWEAKENYGTGGQMCSGFEAGQSGLDATANFVATFLARLISERRESGRSDREAKRGQGCKSVADKSNDLVGHGGCRKQRQ